MNELNSEYVSINRAGMMLDVSSQTIRRWYKWWECPEIKKPEDLSLPQYYYKDRRKTKFFKKSDIPALKEFKNKLQTTHRGIMSEFNAAYQWGKRGEEALKNKGTTINDVQKKMR
jgi:hypothetical protein